LFKALKYDQAISNYSKAIDCAVPGDKSVAPYYSNRAMCQLRSENYGLAISDGEAALATDPTFAKGYYRIGSGYFGMGKLDEALAAFKNINLKLKINDPDTKKKMDFIKVMKKEKAFAESIARPDEMDTIDPEDLEVPESYKGPVIEMEGELTEETVMSALDYMKEQKYIHKKYVWRILKRITAILEKEETLVDVTVADEAKYTICGDIHGQYYDTLNIWSKNGYPSEKNPYLFNGDFVDRGSFSVECILALYIWKIHNPKCMFLNRGNHEGKNMNKLYGFEGEVKHKYCMQTMTLFAHSFNMLPLCHVINKKIMVVHGGLFSKEGVMLDDIKKISRKCEIPESGNMCDILWADPHKGKGRIPSKRGVSIQFGADIAEKFLDDNGLDYLVRSHEMKEEGYEVEANGRVITIFSAPKYCDQMTNKGAYINLKGSEMKPHFVQFDAVPHPAVPCMAYARQTQQFM